MKVGKILNTDKIHLNIKQNMPDKKARFFLCFKVFILIFNAEKKFHVYFTNLIPSGVIMKSVLLTSEARIWLKL